MPFGPPHLIVRPLPLEPWLEEAERVGPVWNRSVQPGRLQTGPTTLECGLLSRYHHRYLASARFFHEAFSKQPELAVKSMDRYTAACAAVLAAAGLGKDAAGLKDEERERWRKQALVWLRADLPALAKALAADPHKAVSDVYPTVSLWQTDGSLATVRDRPELTQRPQAEQDAWQKFWSEVAALRWRAAVIPTGRWRVEGKELVQEQKANAPL